MISIDSIRTRWQHRLKQQSLKIEQILDRWQLSASITGGHIHHPWTYYEFDRSPFPILGQIDTEALLGDLQQALRVPAVKWEHRNGRLTLAVKLEPIPVSLLSVLEDFPDGILHESYLGHTARQTNLYWQLTHPYSSHIVVTGSPGAGATDLLLTQGMALALTHRPDQVRLLLLDGSGDNPSPLQQLTQLPHTLKLATGETAVNLLVGLVHHCLTGPTAAPGLPINNQQPVPANRSASNPINNPTNGPANRLANRLAEQTTHSTTNGPTAYPPNSHQQLTATPATEPTSRPTSPVARPTGGHSTLFAPTAANGYGADHDNGHTPAPLTTGTSKGNGHTATHAHTSTSKGNGYTPAHLTTTNGYGRSSNNGHALLPPSISRLVVICHRLDNLLEREPNLAHVLPALLCRHDLPVNLLASVRPPAFGRWPLLAHFPLRLVGCVPDAATAAHLTGQPHSQAERLLGGGDFLAIAPGRFTHFQAASLDPFDWAYCVDKVMGRGVSTN
jgi:hypothetical protein